MKRKSDSKGIEYTIIKSLTVDKKSCTLIYNDEIKSGKGWAYE
jgi:hypothetical protein